MSVFSLYVYDYKKDDINKGDNRGNKGIMGGRQVRFRKEEVPKDDLLIKILYSE